MKILDRIVENAKGLNKSYAHANQILDTAIKDAMPWAIPLATRGVVPSVDKIERLTTQCMAILIATYPEDFEKSVKGFSPDA